MQSLACCIIKLSKRRQFRDASVPKFGWIFWKTPNGIWPPRPHFNPNMMLEARSLFWQRVSLTVCISMNIVNTQYHIHKLYTYGKRPNFESGVERSKVILLTRVANWISFGLQTQSKATNLFLPLTANYHHCSSTPERIWNLNFQETWSCFNLI